jgi:4-amino-4-deoxy-L-arabinose transferase-like glycosyltransferase
VIQTQKSWLLDILLLCLIIGSCFAFMLGSRPLNVPDEGRYSEIPREMLVSHDFVTPRINHIVYFEKPPLFYWMQTASLKSFGLNEWSSRFMTALMALIGCLGTYVAGRKLYDRKTGWFAALTLSSSLLYFILARFVSPDMTVSVLICFSLFSFILRYYYLLYIFAALAVLAKGLIGIIFPGSIIFLWLLLTNNWKLLKECKLLSGTILFLAITLPWHILVQLRNPEFFNYYFITQQFSRYLTMSAGRYEPTWYYIPIFLLGLFPWTGFLLGTAETTNRKNSTDLFLLISAVFIFVFYSVSHSKLIPYILPCSPFIALLMGKYFASDIKSKRSLVCGFIVTPLMCLGLVIAAWMRLTPDISIDFVQTTLWAKFTIIILTLNIFLVPVIFWKKGFFHAFITQLVLLILFTFSLCGLAPTIYMDSMKPMVVKLNTLLKPDDTVATYHFYYQDIPFYLNNTISIVSWKGELEFGEGYTTPGKQLISDQILWNQWKSKKTVFLFVSDHFYKEINSLPYRYYIIAQDKQDMLISNHPEKS